MTPEPSNHEILEAINDLASNVDRQFADVRSEMADLRSDNAYIHSVMATKDDLVNLATKDDLAQLKSEMTSEIDKFVVVHKALDLELVALSSRCNRIEERIR